MHALAHVHHGPAGPGFGHGQVGVRDTNQAIAEPRSPPCSLSCSLEMQTYVLNHKYALSVVATSPMWALELNRYALHDVMIDEACLETEGHAHTIMFRMVGCEYSRRQCPHLLGCRGVVSLHVEDVLMVVPQEEISFYIYWAAVDYLGFPEVRTWILGCMRAMVEMKVHVFLRL